MSPPGRLPKQPSQSCSPYQQRCITLRATMWIRRTSWRSLWLQTRMQRTHRPRSWRPSTRKRLMRSRPASQTVGMVKAERLGSRVTSTVSHSRLILCFDTRSKLHSGPPCCLRSTRPSVGPRGTSRSRRTARRTIPSTPSYSVR